MHASFSPSIISDDSNKSKPIFNGLVHECLRLESVLDNEEGPEEQEGDENDLDSFVQIKKDSKKIFCPEFYYIYGESLRYLAEFEMCEDIEENSLEQVKGLLSAAIDRFQVADETIKKITANDSMNIQEFSTEMANGLLYAMSALCMLIEENEEMKINLNSLITEESKDFASSAMRDAIEFYCSYIENAYENELKLEGIEEMSSNLENNVEYLYTIEKNFMLTKVDVPLRLSLAKSAEIDEEKAALLLNDLEGILETVKDVHTRYEALQLKASIKEALGQETEADLIYEEASTLL